MVRRLAPPNARAASTSSSSLPCSRFGTKARPIGRCTQSQTATHTRTSAAVTPSSNQRCSGVMAESVQGSSETSATTARKKRVHETLEHDDRDGLGATQAPGRSMTIWYGISKPPKDVAPPMRCDSSAVQSTGRRSISGSNTRARMSSDQASVMMMIATQSRANSR